MAFHVRISNNNLLKLLKLRLKPYAAQVHGEHSLDKTCQRLPGEELTETDICLGDTQNVYKDVHLYMKSTPGLSLLTNDIRISDDQKTSTHRCFRHCSHTSGGHYPRLSSNCDIRPQSSLMPMSLLDVQKILFSTDVLTHQRMTKGSDTLNDIFKPITHTGDDIFFDEIIPRQSKCSLTLKQETHMTGLADALLETESKQITSPVSWQDGLVFCEGSQSRTESGKQKKKEKSPLPTEEQLRLVHEYFVNYLPQFFRVKLDFQCCHNDIIFENNYWGKNKVICGITAYAYELNKIRFLALLKYTRVHMHILKITIHTEDGTVRVRWRISGVPQFRSLFIWKNLFSKGKEIEDVWHDGFSIFYVGNDGLIQKHKVDRIMPDEDPQLRKANTVAARLAILLGLTPKPSLTDFSSLFMKKSAFAAK